MMTLGFTNDLGTCVNYQKIPAKHQTLTKYSLGSHPHMTSTTNMELHPPPPPQDAIAALGPAGEVIPPGVSEVENRFACPDTSKDYNIITGGARLLGGYNLEALKYKNA